MFESWRTDIGETSSGDLRNRVDVDARNNLWNCAISKTAHPPQHGIKRTLSKNLLDGFEGTNFHFTTKKGERNRIGREEAREIKMRKMCRCKIRHSEFRSEYAVVRHTVPCSTRLHVSNISNFSLYCAEERRSGSSLSIYRVTCNVPVSNPIFLRYNFSEGLPNFELGRKGGDIVIGKLFYFGGKRSILTNPSFVE